MKKIAVLVDFTSIGKKALEFAGNIAARTDAELVLVHVAEENSETRLVELESSLNDMHVLVPAASEISNHVATGSFFSVIPTVITDINADMAVVPTHGKVGVMQHLLGSNILKLVKMLPVPTLVVQESSTCTETTFDSLVFPVGPHDDFDVKYKQTAAFAKVMNSTVQIYTVRNDIRGVSDRLLANIKASREYFEAEGVSFNEVSDDPSSFSAGYAKHILNYARTSGSGAVCIMSKVSDDNGYIGNTDKENILLNEAALPVFCTSA